MARIFRVPIDHSQLESLNFRFQNLSSAPGSPVAGQAYFNTATSKFNYHNGSAFVDPTARAQHTGTQLAATISDFDTQVRTNRLDQLAAPTADVNFNGRKLISVANGTAATDGINYGQLLNVLNGTDWKASVRVLSVANITLSGAQTIDSVSVVAGDRVGVIGQTLGATNGLYVVASGAWTRATDADATANADGSSKVTTGLSFFVEEGTTYGSTQWRLTTFNLITVGTTVLTFAQIGAATVYIAGTGITIVGNIINVDTAVVVRKSSPLTIGDGSATSFVLTHNFNTRNIRVTIRNNSTNEYEEVDVTATSVNAVTIIFAVAPTASAYTAVAFG